uniref:hypothetical protein n=1 Tax=Burkholderia sp. AU33423 TaxID=2015355 RepID=UPI00117FF495|nr:hypothetical protein [Burkholderia sp. AU33423]
MSTVEAKLNYAEVFGDVLDQLKSTDAYRHFLTFSRSAGHFPLANYQGKTIEVWCSNDYLGMGQHEKVIASFRHAGRCRRLPSAAVRRPTLSFLHPASHRSRAPPFPDTLDSFVESAR